MKNLFLSAAVILSFQTVKANQADDVSNKLAEIKTTAEETLNKKIKCSEAYDFILKGYTALGVQLGVISLIDQVIQQAQTEGKEVGMDTAALKTEAVQAQKLLEYLSAKIKGKCVKKLFNPKVKLLDK